MPQTFLKAVFESSRAYGLFTAYFDAELYYRAVNFYENNTFGRDRLMYAIVGITRVLEDVEISQSNLLLNQNIKHFIEKDFCLIYKNTQTFDKFKPYLTARVDIAFETKSDKVDFQLNYVSDREAKVFPPAPIKNRNGIVYRIHSWAGNLELVAKAAVEGKIKFWLRGLDIRKPEDNSKRIPHWIDYTKLTVNDKNLFDTLTPAWHDKPYNYNFDAKAGEEIKIQVEWLPHRSDT